uniref:Uncharacterized protein n=1 Tax=Sphaerodactylus townsendi TaxID=933632 RepID=A0ACB8E762_9SAUR
MAETAGKENGGEKRGSTGLRGKDRSFREHSRRERETKGRLVKRDLPGLVGTKGFLLYVDNGIYHDALSDDSTNL